ncbi:hypothetical protein AB0P15_28960 [Streptomyces sp. NPDC087917]|uniref:hypothetical protein n=1 Tax=Streptomyces sp. NPDC087917 TaxID=3155060 RepID=UPI003413F548
MSRTYRRGRTAATCSRWFGGTAPVGVYRTDGLACQALVRSHYSVHPMAII